MSTRGCFGWRVNGEDKIGYNHFDSYLVNLGNKVLEFIRSFESLDALKKHAQEVELDEDDDSLDPYDNVSCIFRKKFSPSERSMHDSLFTEWAYVINVDSRMLEVYRGFNKDSNAAGRYASSFVELPWCVDKYYGVRLAREIPLEDILSGKLEKFTVEDEEKIIEEEKKMYDESFILNRSK